jgi:hypothetical protein
MIFNAALPLHLRPKYSEGTKLASSRDSRNTSQSWKQAIKTADQNNAVTITLQKVMRELAKQRRKPLGGFVPQEIPEPFYPFKIYQPDISTLASMGWTFDINGNPTAINIDATVPTNLPTTINPNTDGWRIWAVREGMVSCRGSQYISFDYQHWLPGLSATTTASDFSFTFEVSEGCDGIGIGSNSVGTPYDYDPVTDFSLNAPVQVTPIVLPFNFDSSGLYSIALWLQIDMVNGGAVLMGTRYQTLAGATNAFPQPTDSSYVPIGSITSLGYNFYANGGNPESLTAYQIQFGNVLSRYGLFQNNLGNTNLDGLLYSATLNYRGDFLNDDGLADNAFYPGDVVKIEQEIDVTATAASTGGITTTVTIELNGNAVGAPGASPNLFVEQLWMMTTTGFTSDPTTDPNWVLISGISLSPITSPTPNT